MNFILYQFPSYEQKYPRQYLFLSCNTLQAGQNITKCLSYFSHLIAIGLKQDIGLGTPLFGLTALNSCFLKILH